MQRTVQGLGFKVRAKAAMSTDNCSSNHGEKLGDFATWAGTLGFASIRVLFC